MGAIWVYYLSAVLLTIANLSSWCLTLLTLPGNWLIVGFTAFFAWLFPADSGNGISWTTVGILIVLAVAGEIIEAVTGAAGAAKQGGSRRSVILSVGGAVIGSLGGAIIGLPIPIVGSAIAAIFGGSIGAFAGALAGESWKGRSLEHGIAIGQAAFIGRILGTVGKLAVGVIMVVIATVDTFA
ncbi:MAG: DUF456 domain-containing protein [Planctomycetaceae bacterium]|nr:DUF456 domain-containing protein [Planctomycetaceae bacterium]